MDFTNFLVRGCPKTAMYIPNFITSEEEQLILSNIDKTPKPKWTQLSHRRLINYGGIPHPNGMIAEEIPNWLTVFVDKINNLDAFDSKRANHILINEYKPGEGIMPHTDGPLFHPIISTISCGSHTVLEFFKKNDLNSEEEDNQITKEMEKSCREPSFKLLIEPRSLLILKDLLYQDYMHSISEIEEDLIGDVVCNLDNCENAYKFGDRIRRSRRISLTIRHVPKTSKLKLKIFT